MACKFGELLAGLEEDRRASVQTLLERRAEPAEIIAVAGVQIYRGTVRQHRDRLCRCVSHVSAATPGPEEAAVPKPRLPIPKDWQPRAEYGADGGYVVTSPRTGTEDPEPESLFAEFPDVDPSRWLIKDVRRSKWQNAQGEWLTSFRAAFVPKQRGADATDVDELLRVVERYSDAPKPDAPAPGTGAYLVPAGDLQLGKVDGGGTSGIIERFCEKTLTAAARYRELRDAGQVSGVVVLPWLGDCLEGSVSQNGRTMARQDLGPSEQLRIYRRLMLFQIETFAPECGELIIPVVPGNHDETTRVQDTHGTDSWAVEGAAAVADALKLAPQAFGHVRFVFPQRGEMSLTVDVAGTRLGFVHGHQFTNRDGAEKWLSGQAMGRNPIGDADLLISAHWHHFRALEFGAGRTWFQVPALDGGSDWFRQKTGASAPAGMLSLRVLDGAWSELTRH